MPIRSNPKTSLQIWPIWVSMGVRGAKKLVARLRVAISGVGKARRSILPLGVKGRALSRTKAWGTI